MNRLASELFRIAKELATFENDGKRKSAVSNFVQVTLGDFASDVQLALEKMAVGNTNFRLSRFVDEARISCDRIGNKIYNAVWKHPDKLNTELYDELIAVVKNLTSLAGNDLEVKKSGQAVMNQADKEIFI